MHIVVLCATQRGLLFLQHLSSLLPEAQLTVFTFREEPCEPLFLDDIRQFILDHHGQFFEAKYIGSVANFWENTTIDLMFVVSWRYIIPKKVYQIARSGTFVFHDSLLPEYRGFAPTVWAILNGEDHTG